MNGLYQICRWVLGGIFIYAGSTKLWEPIVFATLIDAYGILPETLVLPTAIALPLLEIIAGIGLIFDIRGSLSTIAGLLLLFILVLGYGIWMGLDVDCGCFAPGDPEARAFHGLKEALFRDVAMMLAVAFIFAWRKYHAIWPVDIKRYLFLRIQHRR